MSRTARVLVAGGLLVAVVAALATTAGSALPPQESRNVAVPPGVVLPPWPGPRVGLEVLVDGRPVRTIAHEGRVYLAVARLGQEYELRVWNHGPRRIAAVLSVDGLSVMHGRPASEADPGYVVTPHGSVVVKGWRRDRDTVAAFSFQPRDESYASRTGRPENVGVIGLVAFEELTRDPFPLPMEKRDGAPAFRMPGSGGVGGAGAVGGTGTGYGRDVGSSVYEVPFVRGPRRLQVTYYYDTVEALRRAGVPVNDPTPFPRTGDFAPPPPPSRVPGM